MDDWARYQERVLAELERNSRQIDKMSERVNSLHRDIEVIKVKAGLFGSVAGMVSVMLVEFFNRFKV